MLKWRGPVLPRVALLGTIAAAAGSITCVLYVGRGNPSVSLQTLFILWVLFPFVVLVLIYQRSPGWLDRARALIHPLGLAVSAASLAIYGVVAFGPPHSKPAFWFLLVPLISLFAIAVALSVAAARKKRGRDA